MFRTDASLAGFQSILIPAIAQISEENPTFHYEPVLEQINASLENNPLSGCSVFELIILQCYASLIRKNTPEIHFVTLYQEYSGKLKKYKIKNHPQKFSVETSTFSKKV
jgi:hypothetical protein